MMKINRQAWAEEVMMMFPILLWMKVVRPAVLRTFSLEEGEEVEVGLVVLTWSATEVEVEVEVAAAAEVVEEVELFALIGFLMEVEQEQYVKGLKLSLAYLPLKR